jgi:hypothetical protein
LEEIGHFQYNYPHDKIITKMNPTIFKTGGQDDSMPPKRPEDKQPRKKPTNVKKAASANNPVKKTTNKVEDSPARGTRVPKKDHPSPKVSYPGPSMGLSEEVRERIAQRAYEIHQKRGGQHGSDWEDWLQAEREILLHEHQDS